MFFIKEVIIINYLEKKRKAIMSVVDNQGYLNQASGYPTTLFNTLEQKPENITIYGTKEGVGEQTINVFNKDAQRVALSGSIPNDNYSVNGNVISGKTSYNTAIYGIPIAVEPNTKYTFQFDYVEKTRIAYYFYTPNQTQITMDRPDPQYVLDGYYKSFTIPEDINTIYLMIRSNSWDTAWSIQNVMLVKGEYSTILPYEPYDSYKIPIKIKSSNLFSTSNIVKVWTRSEEVYPSKKSTWTYDGDNKIIINKKSGVQEYFWIIVPSPDFNIQVSVNGNCDSRTELENSFKRIVAIDTYDYNSYTDFKNAVGTAFQKTTNTENHPYIAILATTIKSSMAATDIVIDNIMVNKGSTALPYEPYKNQTYNIFSDTPIIYGDDVRIYPNTQQAYRGTKNISNLQDWTQDWKFPQANELTVKTSELPSCIDISYTSKNKNYSIPFWGTSLTGNNSIGTRLGQTISTEPTISTNTVIGQSEFDKVPAFMQIRVNGYYNADGSFTETAVEGIDNAFAADGTNGDVWVRFRKSYISKTLNGKNDTRKITHLYKPNLHIPLHPIFHNNYTNEETDYIYIAAYKLGWGESTMNSQCFDQTSNLGKPSSVSSVPLIRGSYTTREGNGAQGLSQNLQRIYLQNSAGNNDYSPKNDTNLQYTGFTTTEYDFLTSLFMIEFNTRDSEAILSSLGRWNISAKATEAETGVSHITVAPADAEKFLVGGTVSIGTSKTRDENNCHSVVNRKKITNIDTTTGVITIDNNNTTFDITADNYIVTMPWDTGETDNILGHTGTPVFDNKHTNKYRGVEDLFGQTATIFSDILIKDYPNEIYVCNNPTLHSSTITNNYAQLNYNINTVENNFIKTLGYDSDYPCINFATSSEPWISNWSTLTPQYSIRNESNYDTINGYYKFTGNMEGAFDQSDYINPEYIDTGFDPSLHTEWTILLDITGWHTINNTTSTAFTDAGYGNNSVIMRLINSNFLNFGMMYKGTHSAYELNKGTEYQTGSTTLLSDSSLSAGHNFWVIQFKNNQLTFFKKKNGSTNNISLEPYLITTVTPDIISSGNFYLSSLEKVRSFVGYVHDLYIFDSIISEYEISKFLWGTYPLPSEFSVINETQTLTNNQNGYGDTGFTEIPSNLNADSVRAIAYGGNISSSTKWQTGLYSIATDREATSRSTRLAGRLSGCGWRG